MLDLKTLAAGYLEYCRYQKNLNCKTIKAYSIDLKQFQEFMDNAHDELLEEDVDIRYIQKLLGHSSIVTTQIYTHVALSKQRNILTMKHPRNKIKV